MTIWQTVVFALIEAVTEFLPVSSTAQLLLAARLWPVADEELFGFFAVFIQVAAALALVLVFWRCVWENKDIWLKLILAVLPTAVIGLTLHGVVKRYLQDASPLTGWMLIVFGVVFSLLDLYWRRRAPQSDRPPVTDVQLQEDCVSEVRATPWYKMLGVGVAQSLALVPGVSRSGATITGARSLGFSKTAATALAFMIAIPTIVGAEGLDLAKEIWQAWQGEREECDYTCPADEPDCGPYKRCDDVTGECSYIMTDRALVKCEAPALLNRLTKAELALLGGAFGLTFLVSLLLAKRLLRALAAWPFWYFGVYRVIVGIIWLGLFWR